MNSNEKFDLSDFKWCDGLLCKIEWGENGRDVIFEFDTPSNLEKAQGRSALACRWVLGLSIDFDLKNNEAGRPQLWEVNIEKGEDGIWNVLLDFAGHGEVSFSCSDVEAFKLE